jgi:RNA dependent RNA polymerase
LKQRYEFSVLQIRYGGCKGTLSVDPRLDEEEQQYKLIIRDSMNKFTSDHDILEVCKLSAPRKYYLPLEEKIKMQGGNDI